MLSTLSGVSASTLEQNMAVILVPSVEFLRISFPVFPVVWNFPCKLCIAVVYLAAASHAVRVSLKSRLAFWSSSLSTESPSLISLTPLSAPPIVSWFCGPALLMVYCSGSPHLLKVTPTSLWASVLKSTGGPSDVSRSPNSARICRTCWPVT